MFGHNKGSGGLFSSGSGGLLGGGSPMGPRQLNLVPSEGVTGNGMATIGMDNTFSVIAHLPPPHTYSPYSPAVYAAYLVDSKGQNGFYAGTLRAAGNGMYQANFRSPVPLVHFNRVVVSLENPQGIGQAPQGPIVMKVKEGMLDSLGPVKKVGGDMWNKVKGFVGNRIGKKEEVLPEPAQPSPPQQYSSQQMAPQQYPSQQMAPQQYSSQQMAPQQYSSQQMAPQQYPSQQTAPQQYSPQQGGGYRYDAYPKGRGMYQQYQSQSKASAGPPMYSQPSQQQSAPVPPANQTQQPAPAGSDTNMIE